MNEHQKREAESLQKMANNDQLIYITLGIPANKIEEFVEKLQNAGLNIYIKTKDPKKQKTAEMLMMNKDKATIQ